jgi:hypothetical protein
MPGTCGSRRPDAARAVFLHFVAWRWPGRGSVGTVRPSLPPIPRFHTLSTENHHAAADPSSHTQVGVRRLRAARLARRQAIAVEQREPQPRHADAHPHGRPVGLRRALGLWRFAGRPAGLGGCCGGADGAGAAASPAGHHPLRRGGPPVPRGRQRRAARAHDGHLLHQVRRGRGAGHAPRAAPSGELRPRPSRRCTAPSAASSRPAPCACGSWRSPPTLSPPASARPKIEPQPRASVQPSQEPP